MGDKRKKFSGAPRSKRAGAKRRATVYEERRADRDIIHEAAGRAAHENAVRRGGLKVAEQCRDKALHEWVKSRALTADAELGIGGSRCEKKKFQNWR